jgi:hypothetical protein
MLRKPPLVASYIIVIRGYATPYKSEDGYQEREEKEGGEETTEGAGFAGEEEGGCAWEAGAAGGEGEGEGAGVGGTGVGVVVCVVVVVVVGEGTVPVAVAVVVSEELVVVLVVTVVSGRVE